MYNIHVRTSPSLSIANPQYPFRKHASTRIQHHPALQRRRQRFTSQHATTGIVRLHYRRRRTIRTHSGEPTVRRPERQRPPPRSRPSRRRRRHSLYSGFYWPRHRRPLRLEPLHRPTDLSRRQPQIHPSRPRSGRRHSPQWHVVESRRQSRLRRLGAIGKPRLGLGRHAAVLQEERKLHSDPVGRHRRTILESRGCRLPRLRWAGQCELPSLRLERFDQPLRWVERARGSDGFGSQFWRCGGCELLAGRS